MSEHVASKVPRLGRGGPQSTSRDAFRKTWFFWVLVVLAVLVPTYVGTDYVYFVAGMVGIYVLVAVGLNLLYGVAEIVSLGHGAILGLGAYVCGILMSKEGWGLFPSMAAATVAGALIAILLGLPALRLSTWYFALITLAFGEVFVGLITYEKDLTGGHSGLVGIPITFSSQELYWIIIAFNAVGLTIYGTLVHSRIGRGLVAIRGSGEAGAVSGVAAPLLKLGAFGVSGAFAGAAGALFAAEQQVITPEQFGPTLSIFFIVVLVAGGMGRWLGPVVGALAFFAVPELLTSLAEWRVVIYGAALLAFMAFAPDGILGALESVWRWIRARRGGGVPAAPPPSDLPPDDDALTVPRGWTISSVALPSNADRARAATGLEVQDVRMTFGGIHALDGVSMAVAPGTIYGLVGPNGSGKTTLLNVITGIYVPSEGSVRLAGEDITARTPWRIARAGISRTFQTPRLLGELSVVENVLLGGHGAESASSLEIATRLPRARRDARMLRERADALLDALGLDVRRDAPAEELPHGQQRLLEIARALMSEPRVLLLDEPAAGLGADELSVLDEALRDLRQGGLTVLLVEHHIGWVRSIVDGVTVLDQGRVVTAGDPETVFADQQVRETYLGALA